MHRQTRLLALCAAVAACASAPPALSPDASAADASAAPDAPPTPDAVVEDRGPADTRAQVFTYTAGPWPMPPGSERASDCESWTLHNEEPLYLSAVEMQATLGMHHSNWFFVPDTQYPGPDGTWPCRSRNFDQGVASYLGGVFFAQSTQVERETQQFPPGTAVVLPPHARIIGALHRLNASPMARDVSLTLRATTIPRSQVQTRLSPFYLEYNPLSIPPRGRSEFEVECPLDARARSLTGQPLSMRFFYGLAHFHELGSSMRVEVLGGAADATVCSTRPDARQGDSWARTMSPPGRRLRRPRAAAHLRLRQPPRAQTVGYGIGDQEMCIWFGFVRQPWQWAGRCARCGGRGHGAARDPRRRREPPERAVHRALHAPRA
ncbi:MAG: hypothetical protein R3A48_05950 [Polyangiales bacterium]